MKKKLIALFAACSMIATASVGLVQTAYADDAPNLSIVVTDGATDNEKVLTFYYDCEGTFTFQGTLSFAGGDVTIDSVEVPLTYPSGMGDKAQEIADDKKTANIGLAYYGDDPLTTADKSFAIANVTVPGDVDITANFEVEFFTDENWGYYDGIGTITATIPAKASEPETPATVDASVEESKAFVDKNDETKCAVVGKINLTVDGSINLADATYGGNKAQAITDMNDQDLADTVITDADIILFVVINGTTDVAELSNVVFE